MKKVSEVEIEGEKVLLRKDFLGWHVVYPNKDENGKVIWKNLIAGGSWYKLGIIIFIVLIICGCIMEYSTALKLANDCLNNSCIYCQNTLLGLGEEINFSIN